MSTENFWPDSPKLLRNEVVEFLREQGELLPDVTDGLLKASVHVVKCRPDFETINYFIEPVNGFMNTVLFQLFNIERKYDTEYPFTLKVFPSMEKHTYKVEVTDLLSFKTEFKKAIKADLTKYMLKHKQDILLGGKPIADEAFLYQPPVPEQM